MRKGPIVAIAASLILGFGLAGCVQRAPVRVNEEVEIIAPRPPPVLRAEVIPAPPVERERVVWVPGHWQWDGREHIWIAGHYVERPNRAAVWVEGRWVERGGNWVWLPGHWRS